jgi:hypothetical protein
MAATFYSAPKCGLGPAQASDFDPGAYYTGDYFSGGHADGYADYRGAEPVLRREFGNTVNFIQKYRASGRLLDAGCWRRQLQAVRRIVLSNRQVYQCAWNSASTVAVPESNEPPIAMAEGMPFGSSRLIMAATNPAATGRTITK